ncbi:MAG: hypothetical protein LBQ50_05275 [Planctomycetaceae bacterium]|jgi:type III secretory pathway lipoprotein EscJ|nr:hypothetical protein [Planctomycetaceae bacterium]
MKNIFFLLFFVTSFFNIFVLAVGQEENIDSNLIREIIRGHRLLEQSLEHVSGKIERFNKTVLAEKTDSGNRQFLFFKDKNLLRLEYISPQDGTSIAPNHPYNDITKVIIQNNDFNFQYIAVPTTGVPYANLSKSQKPDEAIDLTVDTDFYHNIKSLIAMAGFSVTDLLQAKIETVEKRQYENFPDALWIKGVEENTKDTTASWTIVLNPDQHYALLFYEAQVKYLKTDNKLTSSGKIVSQKTNDGKLFPKEIFFEGRAANFENTQRTIISITSTGKPDNKLFTENSFKDLGRDYVSVTVLPNQKTAPGGKVINAAPLESRVHNYSNPIIPQKLEWSITRITLVIIGVILILLGCFMRIFTRKPSK